DPELPVYNDAVQLTILGALQVDKLRQSHLEIVQRHDLWRTRFESDGSSLRQIVCANGHLEIPVFDLSALDDADRAAQIEQHAREVARTPFVLENSALHRMRILRVSEMEHVVIVAAHHIVFDGGSAGIYFNELFSGYERLLRSETSRLPDLPL